MIGNTVDPIHWLAGPIDDHMSNLIIAQLMYLESENPETPVGMLLQETAYAGMQHCLSSRTLRSFHTGADQHVHQLSGRGSYSRFGYV